MLMHSCMACFAFNPGASRFLAVISFIGSICELFTFLIFLTDLCWQNTCKFNVGAGLAFVSSLLSFVNLVLVFKLQPMTSKETNMLYGAPGLTPGTTLVSEASLLDGSQKIVKATVNADGSQTVEETTIRMEDPSSFDSDSSASEQE